MRSLVTDEDYDTGRRLPRDRCRSRARRSHSLHAPFLYCGCRAARPIGLVACGWIATTAMSSASSPATCCKAWPERDPLVGNIADHVGARSAACPDVAERPAHDGSVAQVTSRLHNRIEHDFPPGAAIDVLRYLEGLSDSEYGGQGRGGSKPRWSLHRTGAGSGSSRWCNFSGSTDAIC